MPQPTHTERTRQLHHLREQIVQRPGMPRAELVEGPKIRCGPTRQVPEGQVFPHPLLQPPRRGEPQHVGIQPHFQQQDRVIGRAALLDVALLKRTQF